MKTLITTLMAKGYWLMTGTIHTPLGMVTYVNKLMHYLKDSGGCFLVREMNTDVREGTPGEVTIVVEFESLDVAQKAYEDPEYQQLIKLRLPHSDLSLSIVEQFGES